MLADGRIGAAYVVRGPHGERRAAHVLHADRVDALREWFIKSAWLREAIDHPHIPRTWAVGTLDDGRPAEITDLLEGETLREALSNRSAPIPLGVVARVVRELAAVLDHLHGRATPVVHRALTPECVLLTAPDGVVKLLGVGDADRPEADPVRPAYLSPEALAEVTSLTARADVFVLASLAYEMLTGKPAFPGTRDEILGRLREAKLPRLADARPEIPEAVDETLHACWALAADQRPSCAMEFALAFSTALGVDDTSEHPVTSDTESGSPSLQVMRRRSALLGPTQEVPAPEMSSRSFLGPVEQTEVSVSAIPEKPVAPRPAALPARPARRSATTPRRASSRPRAAGEARRRRAPRPHAGGHRAAPRRARAGGPPVAGVPAALHPPAPSLRGDGGSAVALRQRPPRDARDAGARPPRRVRRAHTADRGRPPSPRRSPWRRRTSPPARAPRRSRPRPCAAPLPAPRRQPLPQPQPHAQPAPRPRAPPAATRPRPTSSPRRRLRRTCRRRCRSPAPTAPAAAPRVQAPAPRVSAPVPPRRRPRPPRR